MKLGGNKCDLEYPIRLIALLREAGHISETNRLLLENFASKWQVSEFDAIVRCNIIAEEKLADLMAQCLHLERIYSILAEDIDLEVLRILPFFEAVKLEAIAIDKSTSVGEATRIVMVDPTNRIQLQRLSSFFRHGLKICVSDRRTIRAAIQRLYPVEEQIPALFKDLSTHPATGSDLNVE